ncbi:3-isopropylmalate dehydratase small subunit [Pseudomonas umsongensis]|uniref:3-isopropylmalate dehydratase small subunit n=1 Tax=Pseudomonas umsongensis TaxID=198618 RepID=UPI00200B2F65|nr:3-isopropylmalate dehydratase small subunit [Pseudomonas umsongensis]MCK8681852.1 3-isopropylmalate dehydratase small subunit [Pseudomonas umsongensis]
MPTFKRLEGVVAPLDRPNVDTDAILPKQFMKSISRSGYGPYLFDYWRYMDVGEPGMDCNGRRLNSDFTLNQARYKGAQILLCRGNFGCGSSREHAVWALLGYGFRVLIGTSFADIFFNNCFKNGLLPIALPVHYVDQLFADASAACYRLVVDLEQQTIVRPGGEVLRFDIDPFRKSCLLKGVDEIGLTLRRSAEIQAYEQQRQRLEPWLFS